MHCHWCTNNRAPRWTFTDPCEPESRQGSRAESVSPAWLAAPAMNAIKYYFYTPAIKYYFDFIDISFLLSNKIDVLI